MGSCAGNSKRFNFVECLGVTQGHSDRYPRASKAHLVFHSRRSLPHAPRDRAAIFRNQLAGSLSDVCWLLPDADLLPEIPRVDSLAVCGQPHLRASFVLRLECFGLCVCDFSSPADLFSGSFGRTASHDRQKRIVILGCGRMSVGSMAQCGCFARATAYWNEPFWQRSRSMKVDWAKSRSRSTFDRAVL